MYNLIRFTDYIKDRIMTEAEIIKLGCDICSALEASAAKNIVHRDISPEKIFVDTYGNFMLADIGTASEDARRYIAPEILSGSDFDATADIYSLGLILYTLVNNGVLPPEAERGFPVGNASASLANIILTACKADPQKRFKTATAMKNALKSTTQEPANPGIICEYIPSVTPPAPSSSSLSEEKPKKKKGKLILLVLIIALICGIIVCGVFLVIKDPFDWFIQVEEQTDTKNNRDDGNTEEPIENEGDDVLTIEDLQGYWSIELNTVPIMEVAVKETKKEFSDITYKYDPGDAPTLNFILYIEGEGAKVLFITDEAVNLTKNVSLVMLDALMTSRTVNYYLDEDFIESYYDEIEALTARDLFAESEDRVECINDIFFNDEGNLSCTIEGNTVIFCNDDIEFVTEYKDGRLIIKDVVQETDSDGMLESGLTIGEEMNRLTDSDIRKWKSEYNYYTEEDLNSSSSVPQGNGSYISLSC